MNKKHQKPVLKDYGTEADQHWQYEVMELAQKYGFVYYAFGGVALLMTHQEQIEAYGEPEYLRVQQMNGHCPKTFGYEGCLDKDGGIKNCEFCWAAGRGSANGSN